MMRVGLTRTGLARHSIIAVLFIALQFFCAPAVRADNPTAGYPNIPAGLERQVELRQKILSMQRARVPTGLEYDDAVKHPILYWRAWANQKLPFVSVVLILLITVLPIRLIAPNIIARAQLQYEQRWARSLGLGLLFLIIGGSCGGFLARSGLFAPLATVLVATIQLITLFGLTVACNSIGAGALSILRLDKRIGQGKFYNLLPLVTGILLCSLLVLIPGIQLLPGLGNRLLALIASAGTGAVLITFKKSAKDESA
jgi:hypothetical protein